MKELAKTEYEKKEMQEAWKELEDKVLGCITKEEMVLKEKYARKLQMVGQSMQDGEKESKMKLQKIEKR